MKRDRFGEDAPPLLEEVLDELNALRSTFNEKRRASGLLFATAQGGFRSRNGLRKPFLDKHAGITKRFTPHGCRRTRAKLYCRTAGTRMAMDIAGHVTDAMHRHYTPLSASGEGRSRTSGVCAVETDWGRSRSRNRDPNRDPGQQGGEGVRSVVEITQAEGAQ
ncbi:MAG: hypothetical protein ACFB9M_05520 [Myxococcota bacterium]